MKIINLKTWQLTDLKDQSISFAPGINFIWGKNGHGKTNLIEAIHLLGYTKSFRTNKRRELINWKQSEASVFGSIYSSGSDSKDEIGLSLTSKGIDTLICGEKSSVADFLPRLVVVTFAPTQIDIVRGPPEIRRQFMDRHAVNLGFMSVESLVRMGRAIRSKLDLLRNVDLTNLSSTKEQVDIWNGVIASCACEVIQGRRELIENLSNRVQQTHDTFSPEEVTLELHSDFSHIDEITPQLVKQELDTVIDAELNSKRLKKSPTRDDFECRFNGNDARSYASQGQARSLALTLVLTIQQLIYEQKSEWPILLLDDVESELDEQRRSLLFESVTKGGDRQVIITGTAIPQETSSIELGIEVENGVAKSFENFTK